MGEEGGYLNGTTSKTNKPRFYSMSRPYFAGIIKKFEIYTDLYKCHNERFMKIFPMKEGVTRVD